PMNPMPSMPTLIMTALPIPEAYELRSVRKGKGSVRLQADVVRPARDPAQADLAPGQPDPDRFSERNGRTVEPRQEGFQHRLVLQAFRLRMSGETGVTG